MKELYLMVSKIRVKPKIPQNPPLVSTSEPIPPSTNTIDSQATIKIRRKFFKAKKKSFTFVSWRNSTSRSSIWSKYRSGWTPLGFPSSWEFHARSFIEIWGAIAQSQLMDHFRHWEYCLPRCVIIWAQRRVLVRVSFTHQVLFSSKVVFFLSISCGCWAWALAYFHWHSNPSSMGQLLIWDGPSIGISIRWPRPTTSKFISFGLCMGAKKLAPLVPPKLWPFLFQRALCWQHPIAPCLCYSRLPRGWESSFLMHFSWWMERQR